MRMWGADLPDAVRRTLPHRPLPSIDFAAINRAALARMPEVLARLLPGGRVIGSEWHAGSLGGEPGDSLKVRMHGERAGCWADFATGEKGGDPISLAAAVARTRQIEGAKQLARMLGLNATRGGR